MHILIRIYGNSKFLLLHCINTHLRCCQRKFVQKINGTVSSRSSVKVLNWWMSRRNEKHFIVSGSGTSNRTCPSLLFGLENRKLNGRKLNSGSEYKWRIFSVILENSEKSFYKYKYVVHTIYVKWFLQMHKERQNIITS